MASRLAQVLEAARAENLRRLKKLGVELGNGEGLTRTMVRIKDANGKGAIHFAAAEERFEICKYLVDELKIDLDLKDGKGHLSTATYLLKRGADPSTSNNEGYTPLHAAAEKGHTKLVKLLLSKGVNVDALTTSGTPRQKAATHGKEQFIKLLLDHGANPGLFFHHIFTSLLASILARSLRCVELLIERKLKVQKRFLEDKGKGEEAFKKRDYLKAIYWYLKAIESDPCDATVLSNRSLCWACMQEGDRALSDALAWKELKPDWPKAHYREGIAWNILKKFDRAANAFFKGVKLDPKNEKLRNAFRQACEARMGSLNVK